MKRIKLFEEFKADSRMKSSRIGVYHDLGVTDGTFQVWQEMLKDFFSVAAIDVNTDNLNDKLLNSLDLLIIPGGDSFQERLGMNENNINSLLKWSKSGGKLLAVCAGFHLISHGHDWSLNMIEVKSSNANMSEPGYTPAHRTTDNKVALEFEITDAGQQIFSTTKTSATLYYHGGPIGEPLNEDINIILKFKQGVPMQIPGDNYSIGKIAGVVSKFGKGDIIAISPHIEKTLEERDLLANAIKYLVLGDINMQI